MINSYYIERNKNLLTKENKDIVLEEAKRVGIDEKYIKFDKNIDQTTYDAYDNSIHVCGDLFEKIEGFPSFDNDLTIGCKLAREFYGHREIEKDDDIMGRQIYLAIVNRQAVMKTQNLTLEEKKSLYKCALQNLYEEVLNNFNKL